MTRNTNVEISERDGFKLFPHGFADYVRNGNRIDGGWHMSITRHLHVWLCTSGILPNDKKLQCATACSKLYEVDAFLRWPVERRKLTYYSVLIDDLLEILIAISMPYVACKGNSIKYHWPRHWVYFRMNLGCSAAEKTLEQKLAETQICFYRFTNGKGDIDSQIMKKDMQVWTLRDVLHAGGLPPMENRNDYEDMFKPPTLQETAVVGRTSLFESKNDGKGLPTSLPINVRRVLLSAIQRDVANGVLIWQPPITIASRLSITFRNRLAPVTSSNRYVTSTLRATERFHGKAIWDCVKLAVERLDGRVKIFFGRCLAFFRDATGEHYIALRWFEACNGDCNVIDPVVLMPRLQEARVNEPASYGVMPVTAVLNGALLIPYESFYYALQSPREQDVYLSKNEL
jgi:hypothetical protein